MISNNTTNQNSRSNPNHHPLHHFTQHLVKNIISDTNVQFLLQNQILKYSKFQKSFQNIDL